MQETAINPANEREPHHTFASFSTIASARNPANRKRGDDSVVTVSNGESERVAALFTQAALAARQRAEQAQKAAAAARAEQTARALQARTQFD